VSKRHRRGRPRNPTARRRATTLAGRRAPADVGTAELRWHRVTLTTRGDLPDDLLGALYGHGMIEVELYDAGRAFGDLVRLVRRGMGLGDASPAGTWRGILAAAMARSVHPLTDVPGADRARITLARIRGSIGPEPWKALIAATDNSWPPPDEFDGFLAALVFGLSQIAPRLPRHVQTATIP
jgi:hypothetical protein